MDVYLMCGFFFSSRRRHTRFDCDWSSDVCSSDLVRAESIRDLCCGEYSRRPSLGRLHRSTDGARSDSNSEPCHPVEFGQNVFSSLIGPNTPNNNVSIDLLKHLLHRTEHICVVEMGDIYN